MKFNVNNHVKVKLTEVGKKHAKEKYLKLFNYNPPYEYSEPTEDVDGYSEWQLWELMATFGDILYNGCKIPFETIIEIVVDE